MSGFEIAGVILGAMPAIISALHGYQKLHKKRRVFKRKSLYIDRMIRALDWQRQLIHNDVKIVLQNAGVDEMIIDQHVGVGRYQDLLKQDNIQHAVSAFLRDNFSTYLQVIQDCESTLLHVASAVKGFDEYSWIANGSLAGMMGTQQHLQKPGSEFWKKVRFSMRRDDLEASIKEIDRLSRQLERLCEGSQQEHQIMMQSSSAKTRVAVSMLANVRIRALRLYRALAQSWTHSCRDPHGARLYLDYRADEHEASKKSFAPYKIEFNVTLQTCTNPSYHTCVVEALNIDDFEYCSNDSKSTVAFKITSDVVATTKKLDVNNMCHVLNQSGSTKPSLRLYLVENERLCYEHASPGIADRRLSQVHDGKMVSLQHLLQDPTSRRLLQLKPRVKLAAMMASSALQLHATPWCRKLRNESLLFVQDVSGKVDLGHPFVACNFDGNFDGNYNPSAASPSQAEPELLDLGILILELWHNETMETFARDWGVALDDTFDTRQRVARKWIAETKDDLLTSVYDAAVRCINCRFDTVNVDLTDPTLSMSIFDGVAKPLWENCKT